MRLHRWISAPVSKAIVVALVFVCAGFVGHRGSRLPAQTRAKIEATIFAYDGHDFVRTATTLRTREGKSVVNTKLDHDTPAYRALVQKRSYTGVATVFGREYNANYAPLIGDDGGLTGALFVAVAK
jgi:methyl-accepting chemotaxis protein-2 (aspartate sensor receptor)